MNKEHLIEKIKKLLALATDNSTTEYEKSSAMQKAQELMAEYSIEECDLQFTNTQDLILTEKIELHLENHMPAILQDPMFLGSILSPICRNFGCYTYCLIGPNGCHYVMGFKTNIEISKYACDVLINQGIKDFKIGFKIHRSISYSINFWAGFSRGLGARFSKIFNEKAIVLYDKVRDEWSKRVTFAKSINPLTTSTVGAQEGFQSATDAKLREDF